MALIGISGKIGSGKDTIGKIIQLLSEESDLNKWNWKNQEEVFCNLNEDPGINCKWEIRKFADKLKDITCILLGCTREQLEDESFKNSYLSDEWLDVNYKVGKVDESTNFKNKSTVRELLQVLGTEAMRNIIHNNIWINALFADYKPDELPGTLITGIEQMEALNKSLYPNWITTDMRFPNELKAVKDRGGITIRVNRNKTKIVKHDGGLVSINTTKEHESETALDNAEFDYVIDNNSDILHLIEQVKQILIKEKLL